MTDNLVMTQPTSITSASHAGMPLRLPRAAEWAYKATPRKVDLPLVMMVTNRGFLCQSPITASGRLAPNVHAVAVGDVIHLYYARQARAPHAVAAFRVVAPINHPHPTNFGARVPGTALWTAQGERLRTLLTSDMHDGDGYEPIAGEFTGWPVVLVGKAHEYRREMFPSRVTLQRIG